MTTIMIPAHLTTCRTLGRLGLESFISSLSVVRWGFSRDGACLQGCQIIVSLIYYDREEVVYSVKDIENAVWTRIWSNRIEDAQQRLFEMVRRGAVRVINEPFRND
jgi:hypothetical protein